MLPRRAALTGALGGTAALLALRACAARASAGPLFLVCRVHPVEAPAWRWSRQDGAACRGRACPARPRRLPAAGTEEAVVFARRPGTFAAVFEPRSGLVHRRFDTPADRHFYGHGVFEPNGRILFATENDITRGQGVLGLYDAADGYRRVGEVDAAGIGPHDIAMLPDGRTLAVANGGILTLPETGRAMLNVDSMQPSLNLIEAASGRLVEGSAWRPSCTSSRSGIWRRAPDGLIAAGMQWERTAEPAGAAGGRVARRGPRAAAGRRPTCWRRWRPISAASPSTAPGP